MRTHALIVSFFLAGYSGAFAADEKIHSSITAQELPAPEQAEHKQHYNIVVLQGLNKVTGQISRFENPVGSVTRFGTLEIALHRCWKSEPENRPENAALIEISELRSGEAPHKIFLGWMFSSSPGLSGLEHPVYDVTLLDCAVNEETDAPKEEKTEPKPKEKKKK